MTFICRLSLVSFPEDGDMGLLVWLQCAVVDHGRHIHEGDDDDGDWSCDMHLWIACTLLPDKPKALGLIVGQGKTNQVWQI